MQTSEDATTLLHGSEDTDAGYHLDWSGDHDADGVVELVTYFNGPYPGIECPRIGTGGGVFLIVPPSSGTINLVEEAWVTIHHNPGYDFRPEVILTGHSYDGDPYDDLILANRYWAHKTSKTGDTLGRALLYQGGPPGF